MKELGASEGGALFDAGQGAFQAKRLRTHGLTDLVDELSVLAGGDPVAQPGRPRFGLAGTFDDRLAADPAFERSWDRLLLWSEASRYTSDITESDARHLHTAVTDPTCGVLPWLSQNW